MESTVAYNTGIGIICALLFAYAFLLMGYINAEQLNNGVKSFKSATCLKFVLGILFCTISCISYALLKQFSNASSLYLNMSALIVIALFFAMAGDFFMQFIRLDNTKYCIGIILFGICQILLIIREFGIYGINWVSFVATIATLLFFLLLMKFQHWKFGKEKNILVIYTICIAFMGCNGFVSCLIYPSINSIMFGLGALLFLISDVILGIWNYKSGYKVLVDLNRLTYFAGVMMIALSICPLK